VVDDLLNLSQGGHGGYFAVILQVEPGEERLQ
jgi:hypothetical protein